MFFESFRRFNVQFKSKMKLKEEAGRCRESAEAVCKRLIRAGELDEAIEIQDEFLPDLDFEKLLKTIN